MEYTLKIIQYTPVLHFQEDAQAPIRATELKPKLDRFILAKYKDRVEDEFLIKTPNEGTKALNYKVSIVPDGCNREPVTNRNGKPPMFFGDEKYPLITSDNERTVTIKFFSLKAEVIELLENLDWLSFFLANNFGTRQDKGYGSFLPENSDIQALKNKVGKTISPDNGLRLDSYFTVGSQANQWEAVMARIENVAKCMRSGINFGGIYCKSLMFAYAGKKHSDGKRYFWDKRFIKEKFYLQDVFRQRKEHPKSEELKEIENSGKQMEAYLFRDYLGLSTVESWMKPYHSEINKTCNRDIVRFKSPLLFKPVYLSGKWYIFLLHKEIPEEFKQARVTVKDNKNHSANLTPFPQFSMADYLNFLFNKNMQYSQYMSSNKNESIKKVQKIIGDFKCLKDNYKTISIPNSSAPQQPKR